MTTFDIWMIRSNLASIAAGESAERVVATLRHNGYLRVAEEVAREIRMTTGDPYACRTEEELEAMYASDAAHADALRASAGVSEEFPAGEFAIDGFNC